MTRRIDIGIDGGGTGCRVALSLEGGPVALTRGGPANIVTDPAAAEAAIRLALTEALTARGLGFDAMVDARVCAGLAGGRLAGAADAFATRLPFLAYVVDDSVTALEGAFAGAEGTLVSLGTGSFCIRRDARGITHQGGWGFVLGDEGSAAWFGRMALSELLRIEDGRMSRYAADPLIGVLRGAMGLHPVLFARDARPEDFAALAPVILACGSPWSKDLLERVGAEVVVALRQIGHPAGGAWALTGGFASALAARWARSMQTGLQEPLGNALDGALSLARGLP
ncbi:BadF/BadG/BcrA/BcrD ATPase family protein [Roseicyclus mahoneyensis]|uniref:Glucosamine kinase n=1 Tax=Roseicyclus mahoneyensis TaxID=164332 RepID=A0A316GNX2_9RHOB|nr:BadF/BadG/BcrA/BcrD ATPase family protein [Roseicyclus mahoneyensis]PWK62479.1 glucosamine kinase [Roseicyclus mahoneyensis]